MTKIDSVLLVDNDEITNFINARLIKKSNLTENINIAHNGKQALEFFQNCKSNNSPIPQLILLDLSMPVMDGFEFLERFKQLQIPEKNNIVIIVLTTSTNIKDLSKLKEAGSKEVLVKPLTTEKLIQVYQKYFMLIEEGNLV